MVKSDDISGKVSMNQKIPSPRSTCPPWNCGPGGLEFSVPTERKMIYSNDLKFTSTLASISNYRSSNYSVVLRVINKRGEL